MIGNSISAAYITGHIAKLRFANYDKQEKNAIKKSIKLDMSISNNRAVSLERIYNVLDEPIIIKQIIN
jgi:hypothetical protein